MTWSRSLLALQAVLLLGCTIHFLGGTSGGAGTAEHTLGSDDAYISYRYARNLVDGHGLVFNPGEAVEGYSNLLFVLVAAGLLPTVGPENLWPAICALDLLLAMACLATLHRHLRERLGSESATLASLLFAVCPPIWLWVSSGLETLAVLAVQIGVWMACEHLEEGDGRPGEAGRLAALLVVAVLLRADGFVVAAIVAVWLGLRRSYRTLGVVAAVVVPTIAAHFAWRLGTYGDPLPNTAYAKVSEPLLERLGQGARQLGSLALEVGLAPYLIAFGGVAVAALLRPGRLAERAGRVPFRLFFPLGLVAYWLVVGGDHFGERFLLVLYPLGAAIVVRLLPAARPARLAVVAVLLAFQCVPLLRDPAYDYRFTRYDPWLRLGELLAESHPGRTLAVDAAGKIPYASGLVTLDMRGLTDRHIARVQPRGWDTPGHNKQDPEYVLSREPDLIAGWILPNLDLGLGLDRERYRAAGYRLRWLVNMTRTSSPYDIVETTGVSPAELAGAIQAGYRYGVLERMP